MKAEQSRTVRLAARAARGSESQLDRRLKEAHTHIAVDTAIPGALACAEVLVATLLRGPGRVSVDPTGWDAQRLARLSRLVQKLRPDGSFQLTPALELATEIVIGSDSGEISVIPDGHGARLARGGTLVQERTPSMLGIVFAASLAAGEAFKEAAAISSRHAQRPAELAFCPVTLSSDLQVAPPLPAGWRPSLTLAGVGAINTTSSLIIGGLTRHGICLAIDRERYAHENLGTYSLGTTADVAAETAKVDLPPAAQPGWHHHRHHGDVASAILEIDRQALPWTPIVLAGLDNHDARADVQRLQADRLLDAATGDTVVGLRDTQPDGPCLLCMLAPPKRPSPTDALVKLGIPYELAHAPGEALVDEVLIAGAPDENAREILRAQRGTPVCGLLRAAGLTELDPGDFMPSVPFVSQQAACLSIGRLVAIATGIDTAALPNFFQYDTLIGPHTAVRHRRHANPSCNCQQRSETIAAVRQARRSR
jgi:hypothetical protein